MITVSFEVFWIFLILAIFFALFYSLGRKSIFLFSSTKSPDQYKKEREADDNGPLVWRLEQYIHIFIGVFTGWMLLWYLLDIRLSLFDLSKQNAELGLVDVGIFLLSVIGINGRLPSIAHAIVDFMKSGKT